MKRIAETTNTTQSMMPKSSDLFRQMAGVAWLLQRRMARLLFVLLLGLAGLAHDGASAAPDRRVALVIGNGAYENTLRLPNPANDAEDIAAELRKVGFEVFEGRDLKKEAMDRKLEDFARRAQGADAAMVFYAGHGMQYQGENYLLPVDAKLEDEFSLRRETIKMQDILSSLDGVPGVKLIVLDACRDNPLAQRMASRSASRSLTRGLATMSRTAGTLTAYSTQANNVALDGIGRNSFFAAAMIAEMRVPGVHVSEMFHNVRIKVHEQTKGQQIPETSDLLLGRFYFTPPAATPVPPSANTTPAMPPQADADAKAWTAIENARDASVFEKFIRDFPTSRLVGAAAAYARLYALPAQPPQQVATIQPTEPPPLARDAVEPALAPDVQRELQRIGCFAGKLDGAWNKGTTEAARAYAKKVALAGEPALTRSFLDRLRGEQGRVCPLVCNARQIEKDGVCVTKTCPAGQALSRSGACTAVQAEAPAVRRQPAQAPKATGAGSGGRCFTYNGQRFCE